MPTEINDLTDDTAVRALTEVVRLWRAANQAESEAMRAAMDRGDKAEGVPGWLVGAPVVTPESAIMARSVLDTLQRSGDKETRAWVRQSIAVATKVKAQGFDPLSVAVYGTFAIAAILAVRLKKVDFHKGQIDFYRGLPKEAVHFIKAVASTLWKSDPE